VHLESGLVSYIESLWVVLCSMLCNEFSAFVNLSVWFCGFYHSPWITVTVCYVMPHKGGIIILLCFSVVEIQ